MANLRTSGLGTRFRRGPFPRIHALTPVFLDMQPDESSVFGIVEPDEANVRQRGSR